MSPSEKSTYLRVTFEPTGRSVHVLPGTRVIEAAGQAGLAIESPCGGAGTCGKCRVQFMSGSPDASETAGRLLSAAEVAAGWRLACQCRIERDAVIAVPETSLFAERLQILTQSESVKATQDQPHALSGACPATLVEGEPNWAVAFDLGTTTLVGELVELPDGAEHGIAAALNPQVKFGDDVVSRIDRACQSPADADELRRSVLTAIDNLLAELCRKADVAPEHIRAISFAGNTTMQHLLCGWSVGNLARLPFTPDRYEAFEATAAEFGLTRGGDARVFVMPVIGGFVGGDTVAGVLATRLSDVAGPVLMIDIGTNGEIVLAHRGKLWATSAAAGPAFEGARISSGMRAADGAIEKVLFQDDLRYSVIGGSDPIGLCGSALIDAAAEMLRHGLLESTGRICEPGEAAASGALRARLRPDAETGQMEFLLAAGNGRADVTLRQRDIRELQLATGALRAAMLLLLDRIGATPADVQSVLLAGGFGSFIRRSNAQRIGLIPRGIAPQRIGYVGNVSLQGAKWALVSQHARQKAIDLARTVEHVELSADPNFQMAFAEAMIFPEDG